MTQPGPPVAPPALPYRSLAIALAFSAAAYVAATAIADWDGVRRAAMAVPAPVLLLVVLLSLASYLMRFGRWHGLVHFLGHRVPWREHLAIYLAGFAFTVSPGKVGELVRTLLLVPHRVPHADSVAAFVCERTWDLAVLSALSCLALFVFPAYWPTAAIPWVSCMALVAAVRTPLATSLVRRVGRMPAGASVAAGVVALRSLFSAPRVLPALAWTVPAWTMQGLSMVLIVHALGHDVPAAALVGIYSVSILAGALSFIPGGLGATEAAMVLLLVSAGLPAADAVYAALIARALPLWLAVAIGVAAMLRACRARPQST